MGYAQGGKHRHLGEFDQEFSKLAGRDVRIIFTPHLVPVNRGILADCYVARRCAEIHAALVDAYQDEPFVTVLPMGQMPGMGQVAGSNQCHIGVVADRIAGRAMVVSAA